VEIDEPRAGGIKKRRSTDDFDLQYSSNKSDTEGNRKEIIRKFGYVHLERIK
jgi:hypothetical protein